MKRLMHFLRPILTVLELVIAILIIAVTFQFVYRDSYQTWIITAISTFLMVFTTIIWTPQGIELAEKTQRVFNTTLRYKHRASYINNSQKFDKLREFCVIRNAQYEREVLTDILGNYLIKIEELDKYIELKRNSFANGNNEFNDFCSMFSKKQLKILDKYSIKKIKFRKLKPSVLTKGRNSTDRLVPVNSEYFIRSIRLFGKIVWGLLLAVITIWFIVERKDNFGWTEILQIMMWIFSILMNIYSSINFGYKSVYNNRYEYYCDKNERCAEYFAFIGESVEDVDKAIKDQLLSQDESTEHFLIKNKAK